MPFLWQMEEADKDWVMIRMVGGWVFLLVPVHPGSPGQRAIKRLLLLLYCWCPSCHPTNSVKALKAWTIAVFKMTRVTAETLYSHGKNSEKRQVFRRAPKTSIEDTEVMCWGRLFQVWVAAIKNACCWWLTGTCGGWCSWSQMFTTVRVWHQSEFTSKIGNNLRTQSSYINTQVQNTSHHVGGLNLCISQDV